MCYTDIPKGLLKLLSLCIVLTLPSSHAAELLQVGWQSLIGVGILARIRVLSISGARTQVRVHWGTESYQVSAQACIILYICGQKEAFSSTQLTRYIWDNFSILLGTYHLVVTQPSYQNSLSSLFYQEQDINITSVCPAVFIYHVKVASSGHSCLVFMRGIWRCFAVCGEVQQVGKNGWEPVK